MTIPESVTTIKDIAFARCEKLKTVYYKGSRSSWQAISIDNGNEALETAQIIYQYEQGGT